MCVPYFFVSSGDDHSKKKSQNSASQIQQQLTLQQQELIQQLQIIQRQYLMHQGIGLSPLLLAQQQQGTYMHFLFASSI